MKRVSIIIPNYNNGEYIEECLRSAIKQNYQNKEIIIIDDGSTDNSISVTKDFIKNNKKESVRLLTQNNLNAAIARNEGIRVATGDYVLFLDSDDVLEENALNALMTAVEENDAELAIGNFTTIDQDNNFVSSTHVTRDSEILIAADNFARLADIGPAPMNKLYNLRLIKKNNIVWGNVRIGQDLNFYLKYLPFCKKVSLVNKNIYRYRLTPGSISRSYDCRIFDIVSVFDDIERFYKKNDIYKTYGKYLPFQILKHYDIQMSKQIFFKKHKMRNAIVDFFICSAQRVDFSGCDKADENYMKMRKIFSIKCRFKLLYISRLYRQYKLWRLKRSKND
ncbi:glycosyltransferase family 2 protein [Candidatus Saccharibacteria bacterium]|nr:glycosyltransferase family 2 protein [Candidatus Saccharibacteria bacterium]